MEKVYIVYHGWEYEGFEKSTLKVFTDKDDAIYYLDQLNKEYTDEIDQNEMFQTVLIRSK